MKASIEVAKVYGIPIRLHVSLLIVVIVLVKGGMDWKVAIPFEIAFATTIVLHELAHSIVAIRKGCHVRQITLLCLGGVAQMEEIPTKPKDEFVMAVAGPVVSLLIGGVLASFRFLWPFLPRVLWYHAMLLGWINIVLAVFNLLPAFPMDGGRVLRALLSTRMGRLRATLIASRMGQIVAVLMIVLALWIKHWLMAAIFVFIFVAAGNEYKAERYKVMARAAGFGRWSPPEGLDSEGDDEDQVVVGPPPYQSGPGVRTNIRPNRRGPFDRLFRW